MTPRPPHESKPSEGARSLGWAALALSLVVFAILVWWRLPSAPDRGAATLPDHTSTRLVSLAPAITETLLALGAGEQLVGVSQYCRIADLGERPRVGTAITPELEAIARLEPTLIVTSQVAGEQTVPLGRIAPTRQFPWLTLEEVVTSVRELGPLVGRGAASEALAGRLQQTLSAKPGPAAPRVLLAMSYGDTGGTDVWFIRDNSLHGAVLRAAGGKNAVEHDILSQPRLSVEELLRLDPDQLILFIDAEQVSETEARARLEPLRKLTPLRAVREGRLGMLRLPNVFSGGPGILEVVEPLRREIQRLEQGRG